LATVTSNGSLCATGPLSCLSVTLVYCGQTVAWIKMLLSTEVDIGTGDIVLHGDLQLPHGKGDSKPPTFRPTLLWLGCPSQQPTAELLSLWRRSAFCGWIRTQGHGRR